jgi:triacylglycerol lipase
MEGSNRVKTRSARWPWRTLRSLACLLLGGGVACGGEPSSRESGDHVVLLHGLARTDLSMVRLESRLAEAGLDVVNVGYPSTQHSIEYLAEQELGPALKECCTDVEGRIHFVTHSMGGIVLRYYLSDHELEKMGRVVMLSPPNQGSEVADWVAESPLLQRVMGPSAEQLGTGPGSIPNQLGPVDFELGIIAGSRTLNPLFSRMIPGVDDGKVSVERAKVEGMADFLVVPHSHSYIMMSDAVITQVVYFLEHGEFRRESTDVEGVG